MSICRIMRVWESVCNLCRAIPFRCRIWMSNYGVSGWRKCSAFYLICRRLPDCFRQKPTIYRRRNRWNYLRKQVSMN